MLVIGIVGGVASGKSFVAAELGRLGAWVLDVDRLGHEVLRRPDVVRAIHQLWGGSVFGDDGHVDRTALASVVFAPPPEGPEQLASLEQITHPRIAERIEQEIEAARARGNVGVFVLDAAVLLKAGWHRFCGMVVFVDAPRRVRARRCQRRGWSRREMELREARQLPLDIQRARAHAVIDNSQSPSQTIKKIQQFWASLNITNPDGTGRPRPR